MAGIAGYKGRVYATASASVSFTNEATTNAGDDATFTITDADKRFWDDTQALTVEVDDGGGYDPVTTGFSVDYVGGVVTFDPALGVGDTVRVSGEYLPISLVAEAKEFSIDIERNTVDDSVFGDAWETPVTIQGKASGTIKLNWADDTFQPGTAKLALVLYTNEAADERYECYATLTKSGVGVSTTDLVGEELAWSSVGRAYYRDA